MSGALILAAFLLTVDPAIPSTFAPEQCTPLEDVVGKMARAGVTMRRMNDDATMRAAEVFNSHPPATHYVFDFGYYSLMPDGSVAVHLGIGARLCAGFPVPKAEWRILGPIILGVGA